jgi:acylphosphatase
VEAPGGVVKTVRNWSVLANKILLVSDASSCCLEGAGRFLTFMSEVHHVTAFFTGRVQGVGFRYQTLQVAKGFEVSGLVKNLPDGRVQLEAEGRTEEVKDFVTAVHERMTGYIRKVEQTEEKRVGQFRGFLIL